MIGHSIGEYVAACLAGVLFVRCIGAGRRREGDWQLLPVATCSLSCCRKGCNLSRQATLLAASNGPSLCVVSGTKSAVDELEGKLSHKVWGVGVSTSHAFHSQMMEPILGQLRSR